MDVPALKRAQLEDVARHRDRLRESPHLRWLFFEITNRCNLACRHCGSSCLPAGQLLTADDADGVLATLPETVRPMICLTGGEPMLHPDFYEIAARVRDRGFFWGMTTNATLIDGAGAAKLRRAGLSTVSVSLDGMEAAHDALRRRPGAWQAALRGIRALRDAGLDPQVTTVFHRGNLRDFDPLFHLLVGMGVTSWRPINVEPIGRACEAGDLLLRGAEIRSLLARIREKRFDPACPMEVTYGCSHYLGAELERMVRDHYFLCGAGILVAGVRSDGGICACLDVENRPELTQGNIRTDNFWEVWQNGFRAFRRDRTADCARCEACPERFRCGGDSAHTWDYGRGEPLLCMRDFLPETDAGA